MKNLFDKTSFLKTAVDPAHFPHFVKGFAQMPEIAFVGRSNVGKSSLLNHLTGQKIAKTSGTPGKTQAINFFSIAERFLVADLPGYGYAIASKEMKKAWSELLESYLNQREELIGVLFLLDFRYPPSPEDLQMLEWILAKGCKAAYVFTKVDKIEQGQRAHQKEKLLSALDPSLPAILYSIKESDGKKQLTRCVEEWLN